MDQEAICYLIAEKAREGKLVARLKWGDPFVFDQGGVEALFLHEQNIPFEVVPGVPSAIGAAAYAGIPVTYPGAGDTLTFVRGYEDEGRGTPSADWAALAKLEGTIVCVRGPSPADGDGQRAARERPASGGIRGHHLEWHAAVTGKRHGHAGRLADQLREKRPSGPSMLVVGKVVGLRDHLRWFDARPLFGRRVLVTRSREQSAEMVELLEAHGAEAIEAPLINIVPPDDYGPLDQACENAGAFDWIVFTSANGATRIHGSAAGRAAGCASAGRRQVVCCRTGDGRATHEVRAEGRSDPR